MNEKTEIVWTEKDFNADPYRRVTRVGSRFSSFSVQTMIGYIENSSFRFCVDFNGSKRDLEVGVAPDGGKYLKSSADRSFPNSLLLLPEAWDYYRTHPGTPWTPKNDA